MDPRNCLDLTRPARLALYGILAFFDVRRPAEPVFASRDLLCAESLLGSHPTLYRGLALLAAKGYIVREQSRRRAQAVFGQFAVSRIWLTEKALALLGLSGQVRSQRTDQDRSLTTSAANESYSQRPSLNLRNRLQEGELTPNQQLSSKEQPPLQVGPSSRGTKGGSENGIDRTTRLPVELLRLSTLGLSKSRICALMKLARDCGNGGQLGAVVALTWARLRQLGKSAAVFAYLAKLVQQRKDYARLVEIQCLPEDKGQLPQHVIERLNEKLAIFLERAQGMVLVSRSGKHLGPIEQLTTGAIVSLVDAHGVKRILPVNAKLAQQWEEGEILLRKPDAWLPVFGG